MSARVLAIMSILAAAAASATAFAQTPSRETPEVKAMLDEGIARFDKNDFEGALEVFKRAYVKDPEPKVLLDIALAELNGGHVLDALLHLKQFVRDPAADKNKVDAVNRELLPKAMQQTGHISITAPAGTSIAIDGRALDLPAPLADAVDVSPGKHKVTFGGPGGTTMEVEASAGQTVPLTFSPPAPAPAKTESVAPQPPAAAPSRDSGPSRNFWTTNHVVAVGLGAGAVLALGGGVFFAMQSSSAGDDASNLRATLPSSSACVNPSGASTQACSDLQDKVNTQNSDRNLSTGLFIAGGVLAAGAIATLLFWPSTKSDERSASVVPWLGSSGSGAALRGTF